MRSSPAEVSLHEATFSQRQERLRGSNRVGSDANGPNAGTTGHWHPGVTKQTNMPLTSHQRTCALRWRGSENTHVSALGRSLRRLAQSCPWQRSRAAAASHFTTDLYSAFEVYEFDEREATEEAALTKKAIAVGARSVMRPTHECGVSAGHSEVVSWMSRRSVLLRTDASIVCRDRHTLCSPSCKEGERPEGSRVRTARYFFMIDAAGATRRRGRYNRERWAEHLFESDIISRA